MATDPNNNRVSVSQETLRAEIRAANSELELRLRDYIDDALSPVKRSQEAFSRGEFTRAQESALLEVVDKRLEKRARIGLSRRQFRVAVWGVVITFITMIVSSALVVHTIFSSTTVGK